MKDNATGTSDIKEMALKLLRANFGDEVSSNIWLTMFDLIEMAYIRGQRSGIKLTKDMMEIINGQQ